MVVAVRVRDESVEGAVGFGGAADRRAVWIEDAVGVVVNAIAGLASPLAG